MTYTTNLLFKRVWVHFVIAHTIIFNHNNKFLNTFWSGLLSPLDTNITKSIDFNPQTDGKTKVMNSMIVHILHMYKSKNIHTWYESLPYVQHNYKKALHSCTSHNPF
jgi:hypothetical protein